MDLYFEYIEGPYKYKKFLEYENLQHPKYEIKNYKFKFCTKEPELNMKDWDIKIINKQAMLIFDLLFYMEDDIRELIICMRIMNYYFKNEKLFIIEIFNLIIDFFNVLNLAESLLTSKNNSDYLHNLILTINEEKEYKVMLIRLLNIVLDLTKKIKTCSIWSYENNFMLQKSQYKIINNMNNDYYNFNNIKTIGDLYAFLLKDDIRIPYDKTMKDFKNYEEVTEYLKDIDNFEKYYWCN